MSAQVRAVGEIVKDYNDVIYFLLTILKQKSNESKDIRKIAQAGRLLKRTNLLFSISEREAIKLSCDKILSYKVQILNRDEAFFMGRSAADLADGVGVKPENDFDEILESIKEEYKNCSVDEKDLIYQKVINLLKCCIEYKYHSLL